MKNLLSYARRNTQRGLYHTISVVRNFDPQKDLIIFSDPRGGSTWIMEMVNRLPRTAVLWEPLHLRKVKHFNTIGFAWRQYIPEGEEWPEAERAFSSVFNGKILNSWTCQSPRRFLMANRLIIKLCRANAMIPWLTRTFKFECDPIYLVRHPFAVAASQLKHGAWDGKFSGFEIPAGKYADLYRQHADYLLTLRTDYEARVAIWCLTNMIPLGNKRNDKSWITVHYEDLLINSEKEVKRIFDRWSLPMPPGAAEQLQRPSATAKDLTFMGGVEAQLSKWTRVFTHKQIKKMAAVLNYFNVDCYSADDLLPRAGFPRIEV